MILDMFDALELRKTGIPELDEEHENLHDLFIQLRKACISDEKKIIFDILNNIIDSVSSHFAREEDLMNKFRFSDYNDHIADHDNFFQFLSKMVYEIETDNIEYTENEMITFIYNWFTCHIHMDYELASHIITLTYIKQKQYAAA